MLAWKSLVVFLVRGNEYRVSVIESVLNELIGDWNESGRKIRDIDKREIDKIRRRVLSGYEDYLFKSYLYGEIEHYFIRFAGNGR